MSESEVDPMPQEPETMAIRRPDGYAWPDSPPQTRQDAPGSDGTAPGVPAQAEPAERRPAADEAPAYLAMAGERARQRMTEVALEVWRAAPEEGETREFFRRLADAADAAGLLRPTPADDLAFELDRSAVAATQHLRQLDAEIERLSSRYWWAIWWGYLSRRARQGEWARRYPAWAALSASLRARRSR